MAKATTTFEVLKGEYAGLWATCTLKPEHKPEVMATARKIAAGRSRYDDVSKATGVPWYLVGIIHAMECGLNWNQHLHNGDSLKARTHQVPAGRPAKGIPPFSWEESAIDALTMKGKEFDKIRDWSLERVAHCLELYNGWGYRKYHPEVHSPYLWSYTTAYARGKYVSDGVWSATAVSSQSGAMALLKALLELDASAIDFATPSPPKPWPTADATPAPAPSTTRMVTESKTVRLQVAAVGCAAVAKVKAVSLTIGGGLAWMVEQLPDITKEAGEHVSAAKDAAALVGATEVVTGVATTLGIVFAVWVIVRHVRDRTELKSLKGA